MPEMPLDEPIRVVPAPAETLARKDRAVAFLYRSRVAPDDSIEVRNDPAKHLVSLA